MIKLPPIQDLGFTLEELGQIFGVPIDDVAALANGKRSPTVREINVIKGLALAANKSGAVIVATQTTASQPTSQKPKHKDWSAMGKPPAPLPRRESSLKRTVRNPTAIPTLRALDDRLDTL